MKSCTTVRDKEKVWLGIPVVSCVAIETLYTPGTALFGTLMLAVRVALPPLATAMGFAGESVQVAPGRALASQVALIFPL